MLAHRRDQAEGEIAAAALPIARGAAADFAFIRCEAEFLLQIGEHGLQAHFGMRLPGGTHRHGFDQIQDKAVFDAESHHVVQINIVDARERHHIDFDALKAGGLGGFDAFEHLRQAIGAGNVFHAIAAQRIEADIKPAHTSGAQLVCLLAQLGAVGGERNIFHTRLAVDFGRQIGQTFTQQRLAAGEPEALGAQPRKSRSHPRQLFDAEPFFGHGKAFEAFGQAIGAAQIATVGHGNAQIIYGAAKCVG